MSQPILPHFNKAFESRVRLGAMSLLVINESVDFNTLKQALDITDGNLASHITALEKAGYLTVEKSFVGRKPHTEYAATPEGRTAFEAHLNALEQFLKGSG
jgi:DNA-binding HxlR family transcriptional regulator